MRKFMKAQDWLQINQRQVRSISVEHETKEKNHRDNLVYLEK